MVLGGGPACCWILLYRFLGNVKSSVGVWYTSTPGTIAGITCHVSRKIRCFTVWRDASDRDES